MCTVNGDSCDICKHRNDDGTSSFIQKDDEYVCTICGEHFCIPDTIIQNINNAAGFIRGLMGARFGYNILMSE